MRLTYHPIHLKTHLTLMKKPFYPHNVFTAICIAVLSVIAPSVQAEVKPFVQGDKDLRHDLEEIFCRLVLKEKLPDPSPRQPYNLAPLRNRSFEFLSSDIEALVVALGGSVTEREGSRVAITLQGEQWRCHRPHPGKEARRYLVEEARELLERTGVHP